MSAEQSYTRVYPKNTTAAHIVGYMGKVYSEEELAELEEKGYSTDATVGVSGVEATMEEQLSAAIGTRVGKQKAEVNSRGKVTRILEAAIWQRCYADHRLRAPTKAGKRAGKQYQDHSARAGEAL